MKRMLIFFRNKFQRKLELPKSSFTHISGNIRTHIEKYEEAYKLLEEYDKQSKTDSHILAESGRLRKSIEQLQGNSSERRASSSF